MELRRFEAILACLHWTNTAAFSQEEKKERKKVDFFWPLASYLDSLASTSRQYYIPGQDMDVDEQDIDHIVECIVIVYES